MTLDKSGADQLLKALKDLDGAKVEIGIDDPSQENKAKIHEYGTAKIPARAPFKRGINQANKDVEKELDSKIPKVLNGEMEVSTCLLYTSPSPRDRQKSRMPSSA